ncbi:MAG TPA: cytochrome ubiquinol oxidase subunit I [Polyangia bacterium]|nr:cytochrome ubiquinol oxidase subunit I [Polyangia bacterium]
MGLSLGFHIIFAAVGVALPALMVIADLLYLRTRDPEYLTLSKQLAKGTSILFAVGAVSGTVLSFELGLLWPRFMGTFGEAIGLPFALEGFAFFTEAIFLGIYLYGRGRVSQRLHLASGVAVALSGAASALFVTLVNAFMNNPAGVVAEGTRLHFDPVAAMASPSWSYQAVHVLLASYQATAWAMVGIHAAFLLRDPARTLHRKALAIALPVACFTALVQPLSGDRSAKHVAAAQPLKLAALEAQLRTQTAAPLHVGGWPDLETGVIRGALAIPGALSFVAFGDCRAEVKGLQAFPRSDWPPVVAVRTAFQVMVGAGLAMAGLALLSVALALRRRGLPNGRLWLAALAAAGPLGLVALEAGWLVTEWGRQPWIVRGLMRTEQAVTDFPYKAAPFWLFTVVYLLLAVAVVYLLMRQILHAHRAGFVRAADGGVV